MTGDLVIGLLAVVVPAAFLAWALPAAARRDRELLSEYRKKAEQHGWTIPKETPMTDPTSRNSSPSAVWACVVFLLGLMALIGWVCWLVLA